LAGETKSSDAFETVLKREMQRPAASSSADCPAPEVLAAYYDRSLSRADRARVDTHLLACARCQSMMAAIARSDDSPSAASSRREAIFWITRVATPIAAIAATIAFAVGLHHRASPPPEVLALGSSRAAAIQSQEKALAPPPAMEQPAPLPQPAIGSLVARNLSEHHHQMAVRAKAGGANEARPVEVAKALQSQAEVSASSASGAAGVSGSSPGFVIAKPRVQSVASPDGSVVWHFGSQGIILMSENSVPERVVDRTAGELVAGSAPSNDVCWIVGKSGAILRTLDRGAHWQSIKPPVDADFTAISASDSNNATVTASNGRRYLTRDGGISWSAE
jgi:hypothetical protein